MYERLEEVCVMEGEDRDENVRQDKIRKGVGRKITHLHLVLFK